MAKKNRHKGPGRRPRSASGEKATEVVYLRFTPGEKQEIVARVERDGGHELAPAVGRAVLAWARSGA